MMPPKKTRCAILRRFRRRDSYTTKNTNWRRDGSDVTAIDHRPSKVVNRKRYKMMRKRFAENCTCENEKETATSCRQRRSGIFGDRSHGLRADIRVFGRWRWRNTFFPKIIIILLLYIYIYKYMFYYNLCFL